MEKRLERIEKDLIEIKKSLDSKIIKKANQYDEMLINLKNVKIYTTCSQEVNANNGEPFVKVEYHIEPTIISIDDEGNLECNETFRALNLLNLISIEEQSEIQKLINILKIVK